MRWTAPEVPREKVPYVADERTMLEAWLHWHRATMLNNCAGLTADQLKVRSVAEQHPDAEFGHTFVRPGHDVTNSLRWVYVHTIEEYARHNGHADLLRERIDGATGW
jgi:hypothetical protein